MLVTSSGGISPELYELLLRYNLSLIAYLRTYALLWLRVTKCVLQKQILTRKCRIVIYRLWYVWFNSETCWFIRITLVVYNTQCLTVSMAASMHNLNATRSATGPNSFRWRLAEHGNKTERPLNVFIQNRIIHWPQQKGQDYLHRTQLCWWISWLLTDHEQRMMIYPALVGFRADDVA